MEPKITRAMISDVEAAFCELPKIVLRTLGNEREIETLTTSSGPVIYRRFAVPVIAIYAGGVQGLCGLQVAVIGRCDCLRCHAHTDGNLPHYVAQLPNTEYVVSHSRATSYAVVE